MWEPGGGELDSQSIPGGTPKLSLDMGTVQRKGRCLDDARVSNETKGNFETQRRRGIRIL